MIKYGIAIISLFGFLLTNAMTVTSDDNNKSDEMIFRVKNDSQKKSTLQIKIKAKKNDGEIVDITDFFSIVGQGFKINKDSGEISLKITDLSGMNSYDFEKYLVIIKMLDTNKNKLFKQIFPVDIATSPNSYVLKEKLGKDGLRHVKLLKSSSTAL